jgi:hypothetical protein
VVNWIIKFDILNSRQYVKTFLTENGEDSVIARKDTIIQKKIEDRSMSFHNPLNYSLDIDEKTQKHFMDYKKEMKLNDN